MSKRVLIVEDEIFVAMDLESTLQSQGFDVVGIAPDLETAEGYFEQSLDLALVDLNLRDGLTGPQIGERLGASGVTVLFLTANPRLLGEGISGTVGVLTKPTDAASVEAAVKYAMGVRQGQAAEPPTCLRLFG